MRAASPGSLPAARLAQRAHLKAALLMTVQGKHKALTSTAPPIDPRFPVKTGFNADERQRAQEPSVDGRHVAVSAPHGEEQINGELAPPPPSQQQWGSAPDVLSAAPGATAGGASGAAGGGSEGQHGGTRNSRATGEQAEKLARQLDARGVVPHQVQVSRCRRPYVWSSDGTVMYAARRNAAVRICTHTARA